MIFRDCGNYYENSVEKVVSYVRRQLSIELERYPAVNYFIYRPGISTNQVK